MTLAPPARIDDLNVARLNLISTADQVDLREWDVTVTHGERIVRVSCRALPEYLVPHGIDNDVSVALIDLFQTEGQPPDGVLTVGATKLLHLSGFHRSGKYYDLLRTSLERLHTTSFSVSGGWRDHPNRRWTHAQFHFIESLKYTSRPGGGFDERTVIQVRLAEDIVASLRGGYVKPLNIEFMQQLSRPRTRILFRVLDATRHDPERPDETVDAFEMPLMAWADQCKIPSDIPGNIRRALAGPHEELIKRGYLRDVTLFGRGKDQQIRYEFHPNFAPVDPALLRRLRQHEVADGVSRRLARQYSKGFLMACLDRFERLVGSGRLVPKKSAAAALVHLIQNPDSYGDAPAAGVLPPAPRPRRPTAATSDLPDPAEEYTREFADLAPEQAADKVVSRLGLYCKGKLTMSELDAVRVAVLTGALDGAHLVTEVVRAVASLRQDEYLADLKRRLRDTP